MLGIDIIKISRVGEACGKTAFTERIFTAGELEYYRANGRRAETLAGFWAAKEAFIKASGITADYADIAVKHYESGKPYIVCEKFKNGKEVEASVSHDGEYAVAVVMLPQNG